MSRNSETTIVSQSEADLRKTTFSIPEDLLKAVKIHAVNTGMDAQDIYVAAVRDYLKKAKAA